MIAGAARYSPVLRFPDYLELDVYATGERRLAVVTRNGRRLQAVPAAISATTHSRSSSGSEHGCRSTLEQRDIESDDGLFKRYLERIPVVEIDGQEAFELFVDEQQFERRLSRVDGS